MKILRMILTEFLRKSQIQIDITGFDMEGFSAAMHQELSRRLDMIEYIVFEEDESISDSKKIASIKHLFRDEIYGKE